MRVAITGGTGFVGGHLAEQLLEDGHDLVQIARGTEGYGAQFLDHPRSEHVQASVHEQETLETAFSDCDAVAHLAGINIERGSGTYETVHVRGTESVVNAARVAGVERIAVLSFLRARPGSGSPYHESKWQKEQIVRSSDLTATVLKAGVIYGTGDHMLDHLAKAQNTLPVFGLVGRSPRPVAPVSVHDVVSILQASVIDGRLADSTVAVTGPDTLSLADACTRVADVIGASPRYVRLPVLFHYPIAGIMELIMDEPITALAQTQILAEGIVDPAPEGVCEPLPEDLQPAIPFEEESIRAGLPDDLTFDVSDLCLPTGIRSTVRTTAQLMWHALRSRP